MKISLKHRALSNGMSGYYLEYYLGYSRDKAGKIIHKRKKVNLNIYYHTKPRNPFEREENKEALKHAHNILINKQAEALKNNYSFIQEFKMNTNFFDYLDSLIEQKNSSAGNYSNWLSFRKHFLKFCNKYNIYSESLTFKQIDEDIIRKFREYLLNENIGRFESRLRVNSKASYFSKLKLLFKLAQRDKIIFDNPAYSVPYIKNEPTEREYLTIEDVQALARTDCRYDSLKRAFLFSCLTGLRWSDIIKLKWSDISRFNGGYRITFRQKKTKSLEYSDLSEQARELLGDARDGDKKIFIGLTYSSYMNVALKEWCLNAGIINKHITFHSARHTFATLLLTQGVDIYTVSKLLGHSNLRTTEIYAKIIDSKKKEAVDSIPAITINLKSEK